MKDILINILRWIGAVILPIPAMLIIPPIVALGLSLSGIIEPDTFAGRHIRFLINGIVLPFIPWFLAPKHKSISGITISAIYFILGMVFTVAQFKDPHSGTLGQTFVLIGMIIGISMIGYQGFQEHKESEAIKDAGDLISIAKDFLPKDTFERYNMLSRGLTINNMYDQYLSILIWLWIQHLTKTKSDSKFFVEAINTLATDASRLNRERTYEMRYGLQNEPLDEFLVSLLPGKSVEYIRQLSYVLHSATRNLVGRGENETALAKEFAGHVVEFMKANDL